MRMRRTATVTNPLSGNKIQLRTIFSIYAIFLVAVAARYGWQLWNVWRNGPPKTELEVALEAADAKDRP